MISRPPPPLWAHHHGGVLWQVRAAAGRSQMFEASAGRAQSSLNATNVFRSSLGKRVELGWDFEGWQGFIRWLRFRVGEEYGLADWCRGRRGLYWAGFNSSLSHNRQINGSPALDYPLIC